MIYHEIIISLPRDLVILHDSLLVLGQALHLWRQDKAFQGNTRVSCQEEQVGHYYKQDNTWRITFTHKSLFGSISNFVYLKQISSHTLFLSIVF